MAQEIKLDDLVYVATYGCKQKQIKCPHCLGTRYCTVIIATGEKFTVDCGTCSRGFDGSAGTITDYDYTPEVKKVRINRIEMRISGNEYYSEDGYVYDRSKVFLNEEDAEREAQKITAQAIVEQAYKISTKQKDTKSWAWNASYHKKNIEKAHKDIAYHSAKLDAAKAHIKEEKSA